jgi:hypothetical protein
MSREGIGGQDNRGRDEAEELRRQAANIRTFADRLEGWSPQVVEQLLLQARNLEVTAAGLDSASPELTPFARA